MRLIIIGLEWAAFRCGSGVVACSEQLARVMHADYGCPEVPSVVSNIWDPSTFARTLADGDLEDGRWPSIRRLMFRHNPAVRRIALYQGGVGPGRDLFTVIRAVALLPEECGLVVIGPGQESFRGSLRREAAARGVSRRVLILSPVHPLSVAQMIPEADVGIASYEPTSRNNINCNPNKLSEYAISGIPIVGTEQKAIREFVTLHGNGVTYRPGDVESCAEALRVSIVHEPTASALRERARAAHSRVSWESERQRLGVVFEQVFRRAS